MTVVLPKDYVPSEDEPYMCDKHLEYFRQKLLEWKEELLNQSTDTLDSLKEIGGMNTADATDRASVEGDKNMELRTRDRMRKVLQKIDQALDRIADGSFGYCEETGDPIGLKRLMARPVATMTIEAQERHERMERINK
ncbi:MAG: RNA polymerase-binding protein DksA [Alphaproteobacteria bacterium]|nr:RNA polymerase-binding protein DksA [Alphaproteobacteria bacterium]